MKLYMKYILAIIGIVVVLYGLGKARDSAHSIGEVRAKVLQVLETKTEKNIDGRELSIQKIQVEILTGNEKGKTVSLLNDYTMLKKGDRAFITRLEDNEKETYILTEPDRLPVLLGLLLFFIVLTIFFGGMQGVRGLVALAGSFLLIGYLLLPGILHGYPVLPITIGVASLIIILGSYITHGFNKTTTAAVMGMITTVIFTGLLSYIVVHMARFNGISSEEDFYLTQLENNIDLIGLLLGGMIIGLLGVLYDAAISQAIVVEELHQVAPHLSRKEIFARAIRIGREHIGALVDTLAIAYVGVSLPILLIFASTSNLPFLKIANEQLFATEIIRILIGSIGLILAIPITTALSVWILMKHKHAEDDVSLETMQKEQDALKHFHHHH